MTLGEIYHIYNHANGNEILFKEAENYRYFLQQFEKYVHPIVNTYAYCLLPNHFHLLLKIKDTSELENLPGFKNLEGVSASDRVTKHFSNLFNSYTKAFNTKYFRRGSLFEKSFKRKSIESDHQFQDTFLYINLNPVKHGFVNDAGKWRWSSYNSYLRIDGKSLLSRKEPIMYFDNLENLQFCLNEKSEIILNMNLE